MPDVLVSSFTAMPPVDLAIAASALVAAYAVFTLVGFGSALIAGAPLASIMPVSRVVPLLAMLDFSGSAWRAWKGRAEVCWPAFGQLFPGMLLGQLLGIALLAHLPAGPMAVLLGLFVIGQGVRGLLGKTAALGGGPLSGVVHGLFGGMLGGLFGSGGFVYAAYLERRLASRSAFRATQGAIIALSTGWRIVLCVVAGVLDTRLLQVALLLAPALALGVLLGRRIDLRIGRQQLFRILNGLLVASGLSLLLRYLS